MCCDVVWMCQWLTLITFFSINVSSPTFSYALTLLHTLTHTSTLVAIMINPLGHLYVKRLTNAEKDWKLPTIKIICTYRSYLGISSFIFCSVFLFILYHICSGGLVYIQVLLLLYLCEQLLTIVAEWNAVRYADCFATNFVMLDSFACFLYISISFVVDVNTFWLRRRQRQHQCDK